MPDLYTSLQWHRSAMHDYLEAARPLTPESWGRPVGPGKWSPAQISEHLILAYELALDTIAGNSSPGAAPRLLRPLLRVFILRPILRRGRFPVASKTPDELVPGSRPDTSAMVLYRLQAASTSFEREAAAKRGTVDHPAFGALSVPDLVRFMELHTRHHAAQMPQDPASIATAVFE